MGSRIKRIAMWSGPRNISTAMMRAWGQRADTIVCDEPFYAYYLKATGRDHPARDEVIAHHESDPAKIIAWLTGPSPEGKTVFYQKHMTQHLLPEIDRSWFDAVEHGFLIRSPEEVITSFMKNVPDVTVADTGMVQQVEIFREVKRRTGRTPPVIDARDVLTDPGGVLSRLCAALDLEFTEEMLSWPPGRRRTDGIWAPHWYAAVEKSTEFGEYRPKGERVPDGLRDVLEACRASYEEMAAHRLTA